MKPYKLERFATLNEKQEEYNELTPLGMSDDGAYGAKLYYINYSKVVYSLEILRDGETFKLTLPGREGFLIGTSKDLAVNAEYYKSLFAGDALYNWINECIQHFHDDVAEDNEKHQPFMAKNYLYENIPINGSNYQLVYNTYQNRGYLYLPARVINFTNTNLYNDMPELPALEDGALEVDIRGRLSDAHVDLPDSPYILSFILKKKKT